MVDILIIVYYDESTSRNYESAMCVVDVTPPKISVRAVLSVPIRPLFFYSCGFNTMALCIKGMAYSICQRWLTFFTIFVSIGKH